MQNVNAKMAIIGFKENVENAQEEVCFMNFSEDVNVKMDMIIALSLIHV